MDNFKTKDYKIFEMFDKDWGLVTAGTMERHNSCTISWGSLGNIWGDGNKSLPIVTIYIHPARYTSKFLNDSDTFTVSFYPKNYKKALGYMGSHSGRDGNKDEEARLTPIQMGESITFEEANLTFLCKKLYQHQFSQENLSPKVKEYYASTQKFSQTLKEDGNRTSYLSER